MSTKQTNSTLLIIIGFATGCTTILTAQWILGRKRRSLKDGMKDNVTTPVRTAVDSILSLTPLMRQEQLSRHFLYFGESGMEQLQASRVLIVGVGGVGSHAAHMLARSGLGSIKLVDYDQLTLSSLNRHACGVLADVGRPKVECMANFMRQICPNPEYLQVETENVMYTADNGASLLDHGESGKPWNMVLDCIDDIPTKAALVADCLKRKIPVISCMSAGGKADPTRLLLTDLKSAAKDPLATKLRVTLTNHHYHHNIPDTALEDMDQLTIIYSYEKTVMKLADFTEEQKAAGVHQFGAVDGMRIRIVPVQGTMPAIMGQGMAAYCLNRLTNGTMRPATVERLGKSTRHKLYQHFQNRERKLHDTAHNATIVSKIERVDEQDEDLGEYVTFHSKNGNETTWWVGTTLQVNITDDLEYLLETWRNRCAITRSRIGTTLHLVRWDLQRPSTIDNIVLIGGNILPKFDDDLETFKAKMNEDVRRSIEQRLLRSRVD